MLYLLFKNLSFYMGIFFLLLQQLFAILMLHKKGLKG